MAKKKPTGPPPRLEGKERLALRAKLTGSVTTGLIIAEMSRRSLQSSAEMEQVGQAMPQFAVRIADKLLDLLESTNELPVT